MVKVVGGAETAWSTSFISGWLRMSENNAWFHRTGLEAIALFLYYFIDVFLHPAFKEMKIGNEW